LAFGSVTEKVVRLASCPVLTVRGIEKRIASEQRLS
jgi:nucleotide-binding universal stress UspA family protein